MDEPKCRSVKIIVPSVPVAQPRVKATIRGKHAGVYTPAGPVDAFKALLRLTAAHAYCGSIEGRLMSGPLSVDIAFIFPRTKSQIWKTRPMPRIRHVKKPDVDNLAKSVFDTLNGLVWVDDAQVCEGRFAKWIAAGDESARVEITITELAE